MLRRIFRVLFGFILACLAAAATIVAFADIQELKMLDTDAAEELLSTYGLRVLSFAVQGIMYYAVPVALIGVLIGEWRRIQSWSYYTLVALAITLAGCLAWYFNEPMIVNNYALTAFLTAGFAGGFVYWLFAGRRAGMPHARLTQYDFAKSSGGPVNKSSGGPAKKQGSDKTGPQDDSPKPQVKPDKEKPQASPDKEKPQAEKVEKETIKSAGRPEMPKVVKDAKARLQQAINVPPKQKQTDKPATSVPKTTSDPKKADNHE